MKVEEYFNKKENFDKLIKGFFKYLCDNEYEIYNEFSFQHELGFYFRITFKENCEDYLDYKIEFERNAKKHFKVLYNPYSLYNEHLKKEIDICIYKKDNTKRFAIELKFPLNRQYPEQMFSFIKDIRFMQELVDQKKFDRTYCLTLVWSMGRGRPFYNGNQISDVGIDIYKYFRGDTEEITGIIEKPTGNNKYIINLGDNKYKIEWKDCNIFNNSENERYKYRRCKYYIVECK